MSRESRVRELSQPSRAWAGASRDDAAVARWSTRAEQNSQLAPRASDGAMKLPDTGGKTNLRSTGMAPKAARTVDARSAAKSDTNHSGTGPFMKSIRRQS